MKRNLPLRAGSVILAALVVLGLYQVSQAKTSGAPAGNTGSPDDGQTCANTGCHTGTANARIGMITTDVPVTGYLFGETYTITVTISEPGIEKFGFQASPQNPTGALMGIMTLIDDVETKLLSGGRYITHTSSGTAGAASRTWTFNWTPDASTGDVTFYTAVNASNNEGNASGDRIFFDQVTVIEDINNNPVAVTNAQNISFNIISAQQGSLSVNVSSPLNAPMQIILTDMQGRTLVRDQYDFSNGTFDIPVSEISGGTYLVTLTGSFGKVTKKVMLL